MAPNQQLAGAGQTDKLLEFGREGCEFESSHRRPTFPIGNPMMATFHFLKNNARRYFMNEGRKGQKVKDKYCRYLFQAHK